MVKNKKNSDEKQIHEKLSEIYYKPEIYGQAKSYKKIVRHYKIFKKGN